MDYLGEKASLTPISHSGSREFASAGECYDIVRSDIRWFCIYWLLIQAGFSNTPCTPSKPLRPHEWKRGESNSCPKCRWCHLFHKSGKPPVGFEPTTYALQKRCSTTELLGIGVFIQKVFNRVCYIIHSISKKWMLTRMLF